MTVRYLNSAKKRLGDYLVELGFITEAQLDAALKEQKEKGGKLGTLLIQLGFLSEDVLLAILGKQSGVSYVSLTEFGEISPDAIKSVPGTIARNQLLIPIKKEGNLLTIAIADPLNVFATEDLKALTGCDIKMVVASDSEIKAALEKYYVKSEASPMSRTETRAQNNAALGTEDDPAVTLANTILLEAIDQSASDVHIEPYGGRLLVRFRLDGVLKSHSSPPKEMHSSLVSRLKILANMDISERRIPQDGRAKIQANGRDVDVRISTIPTAHGERAVLRFFDPRELRPDLAELGLEEKDLEQFRRQLKSRCGLVIVSGPASAGKSTTLYCALTSVNAPDLSSMAVENSVRHLIPAVSQVQARQDIGLSTANVVNAFIRQDADVIMVGEIQDAEAATASANAAMEGRLVLAGFLADDAAATIVRLLELGIEPSLLASSLKLVVAQRMIRRVCEACRTEEKVSGGEIKNLGGVSDPGQKHKIYRASGCETCHRTGYAHRIGAFEMAPMTEELHRLIVNRATVQEIRASIRRTGTDSLRNAAMKLVLKGLTTLYEVVRVTHPDDARRDK